MDAATFLRAAEGLPLVGLDALIPAPGGTALVLAPHPDDEALGCGGLLAALAASGRPPARAVFVSDGAASHPGSRTHPPARLRDLRAAEALAALAELGHAAARAAFLGLPDSAVPHAGPGFDAAVSAICHLARRDGDAALLVAPWGLDLHGDHGATWRMARAAAADLALPLVAVPVWGWRYAYPGLLPEPPPPAPRLPGPPRGVRLDVSAHLDAKRRAVAAHASQHAGGPVADSPAGFALPPAFLALMLRPWELYLDAASAGDPGPPPPGAPGVPPTPR